jgi:hypothetical protein
MYKKVGETVKKVGEINFIKEPTTSKNYYKFLFDFTFLVKVTK